MFNPPAARIGLPNLLAYPIGVAPGINYSHVAFSGFTATSKTLMFQSYVPSGGSGGLVNLAQPSGLPTLTGTPTTGTDARIGPYVNFAAGSIAATFASPFPTASPTSATYAAIFIPNAAAGGTVQLLLALTNVNTNSNGLCLGATAGAPGPINQGTIIALTGIPAIAAGVPYFFAVSWKAGSQFGVLVNLATGLTSVGSSTTAGANFATLAGWCVGGMTNFGGANSKIAAGAIFLNCFLQQAQLSAWATNPWGFWYPPTAPLFISSTAPAAAVSRSTMPLMGVG